MSLQNVLRSSNNLCFLYCAAVFPLKRSSEWWRCLTVNETLYHYILLSLVVLNLTMKVWSTLNHDLIRVIKHNMYFLWLLLVSASCLPLVPEQGTVGASGDLAPLAHLALGAIGEGKMWSPKSGWADAKDVISLHLFQFRFYWSSDLFYIFHIQFLLLL